VQSVYDQLVALIDKAGLDHEVANALVSGQGAHAEVEIINDLWAMGRGQLEIGSFIARHGYHGPLEGEFSGRVWREDPTPVIRLAEQYAERSDLDDPAAAAEARADARRRAERLLLAELPRAHRVPARVILRMAVLRIPLRGVAKAAYLQSLDVARGAARRLGTHLADQGVLADPEDVFMFTTEELRTRLPGYAREMVEERRVQREQFQRHTIPAHWRGNPVPALISSGPATDRLDHDTGSGAAEMVVGIGASGGRVEGVVRIVHDPTFAEVEPDEVLVCVTTDPSWASVLFLSSALVVDIGGLLSHAAVVAREVGVPCVIGTGNGTAVLRTGDLVRVDGNAGTVEILKRAPIEPDDAGSPTNEMGSA
jgi:pyruvate,water dikinase